MTELKPCPFCGETVENERVMTINDLKTILEEHKLWLSDATKGKQADLCGADLSGANLREAVLFRADLSRADLAWADLSEANLREANLREANLSVANLSKADLSRADLAWADLCGADLCGANLHEANLWGANLLGANMQGANLFEASLDFSCLPLWCGGLDIKVDDSFIYQLAYHLTHQDISACSDKVKSLLAAVPADLVSGFTAWEIDEAKGRAGSE